MQCYEKALSLTEKQNGSKSKHFVKHPNNKTGDRCPKEQAMGLQHPSTVAPTCLQITDQKHPECVIRQITAGPITGDPGAILPHVARGTNLSVSGPIGDGRFSFNLVTSKVFAEHGNGGSSSDTEGGPDASGVITAGLAVSVASSEPIPPKGGEGQEDVAHRKQGQGTKGASGTTPKWDGSGMSIDVDKRQCVGKVSALLESLKDSSRGLTGAAGIARAMAEASDGQLLTVSAEGECSFLDAVLFAGLSPVEAAAADLDPVSTRLGVKASVAARAVTAPFVGARVVLGPVVGRVTQNTAVVLVEVASKAPLACVLTDSVSGARHRQVVDA